MPQKKSSNRLRIRCRKHPRYNAERTTKKCASCSLVYILHYQHTKQAGNLLGGIDPYQFIDDLKGALEYLEIWRDTGLKPLIASKKRIHFPSCPASVDELLGCNCAKLRGE